MWLYVLSSLGIGGAIFASFREKLNILIQTFTTDGF